MVSLSVHLFATPSMVQQQRSCTKVVEVGQQPCALQPVDDRARGAAWRPAVGAGGGRDDEKHTERGVHVACGRERLG
jgi:hypothetical protein